MAPRRRRGGGGARGFERTDRLGELLREIVAEQLERIGDERLALVTITGVVVDRELERARVYYTCLDGDDRAQHVIEGFAEVRGRLRKAIGDQARVRRVPQLSFEPDDTLRAAERIEEIIREIEPGGEAEPAEPAGPEDDGPGT